MMVGISERERRIGCPWLAAAATGDWLPQAEGLAAGGIGGWQRKAEARDPTRPDTKAEATQLLCNAQHNSDRFC